MKKNKEVLMHLPETKMWTGMILYTNKTYNYVNSNGEVIGQCTGKWKKVDNDIHITFGFDWVNLSKLRTDLPNLLDLIAWEQIEREILS
jgi:hypothetical protein